LLELGEKIKSSKYKKSLYLTSRGYCWRCSCEVTVDLPFFSIKLSVEAPPPPPQQVVLLVPQGPNPSEAAAAAAAESGGDAAVPGADAAVAVAAADPGVHVAPRAGHLP